MVALSCSLRLVRSHLPPDEILNRAEQASAGIPDGGGRGHHPFHGRLDFRPLCWRIRTPYLPLKR